MNLCVKTCRRVFSHALTYSMSLRVAHWPSWCEITPLLVLKLEYFQTAAPCCCQPEIKAESWQSGRALGEVKQPSDISLNARHVHVFYFKEAL